ncbi:hypothetical protein BRC93_11555 [Halobacteriales archaeon QS_5_70_15]|nr:MAG: hypothetical protein BRC93_11555 [Halobacteriales archaeon QS_5_70_15]
MSDSTTTRQEPTNGRVRTALEGAIKRPVREAVREALAEGVTGSAGQSTEDEPVEVDPPDAGDGSESSSDDTAESTETGRSLPRRLLGSRRAVGLVALLVATYLRRRRRSNDTTAE